jgi:hypothetical protein
MTALDEIMELFPDEEFIIADGLDSAIIGLDPYKMVLIYSIDRVLEIFVERDGMTPDDAIEFFDFNVAGAYVGERTPIWFDDSFDEEE